MPVTYTNRKGVTYTLFRSEGPPGRFQHVFAQRSDGEPVDELPPGFRVSESPNGLVSLVKERPVLILPEEVAAVEAEVAAHPHAQQFRVTVKPDQIEIYAKEGYDRSDVYRAWQDAGLMPRRPGNEPGNRRALDPLRADAALHPPRPGEAFVPRGRAA